MKNRRKHQRRKGSNGTGNEDEQEASAADERLPDINDLDEGEMSDDDDDEYDAGTNDNELEK